MNLSYFSHSADRMMSLAGRICLVTGATRGIGKGIAVQLGEAGATVYITGKVIRLCDVLFFFATFK